MPYIKMNERNEVDDLVIELSCLVRSEGQLNYIITKLCHRWLDSRRESYSELNKLIGVLECAKLEFYRRVCSSYEDTKIKENGDV